MDVKPATRRIAFLNFLAGYQVSDMATFRPCGTSAVVGERIGDLALNDIDQSKLLECCP
jgi:hypothetical protein